MKPEKPIKPEFDDGKKVFIEVMVWLALTGVFLIQMLWWYLTARNDREMRK